MTRRLLAGPAVMAGLLCVTWCAPGRAASDQERLAAALPGIEAAISKSGAEVAVAFETLDGGLKWLRHPDDSLHAASTMKVGVLIELYRQAHEGQLRLDDPLVVKNQFASLVDGSPYSLNAADDDETTLYAVVGETRTLRQLSELMITVSSNFATNLLIQKLGVDHIRATMHALGADGMNIRRGVEDSKAFAKGLNNTTTARALLTLMTAIASGRAVDAESSHQMQAVLERQHSNDAIPAGLPPGTRVAHKTGEITAIKHDAAIVLAPRPFVLVVMTRGLAKNEDASALIAELTRRLYRASQPR
jgi:beta-lactamase class A